MKLRTQTRPMLSLIILSLCLLFLSVNGFIGGYLMLSDPNGAPMGMPVTDLARTPFQNFVIPGWILIVVWGLGSLLVLLSLWLRPHLSFLDGIAQATHEHWAWLASIVLGLGLLVWLTVQLFTLPQMAPVQLLLYTLAVLMVLLPFMPGMRRYYHLS